MTRAEVLVALGLPADSKAVWPACGCADDHDDPDCGGTGDAADCAGPSHPALFVLGPRGHYEDDDFEPDRSEYVQDIDCRCPCHGGSS